jgi:DNA-binding NarL/FixJ family response regulator
MPASPRTEVRVWRRRASPHTMLGEAQLRTMSDPATEMVRVMIVEDDRAARLRFAEPISSDARTTLTQEVRTGREATAQPLAARPDVLLVDLGLPDIHGTEVIRFAARTLPDCEVMVITVFGDERNVLASIEAGAAGYVLKDCSDSDLVDHVLELRAGGAAVSPGVARMVLDRMRVGDGIEDHRKTVTEGPANKGDSLPVTAGEAQVLRLIVRGYTYGEVAERLDIPAHTVGSHVKKTYRKLSVHTAAAAVARAAELRLLDKR